MGGGRGAAAILHLWQEGGLGEGVAVGLAPAGM